MTNKFDALKAELLAKYPSVKTLGWLDRIKAHFSGDESEAGLEYTDGVGRWSQRAVLVRYKGKEYLKRFGRLFD